MLFGVSNNLSRTQHFKTTESQEGETKDNVPFSYLSGRGISSGGMEGELMVPLSKSTSSSPMLFWFISMEESGSTQAKTEN